VAQEKVERTRHRFWCPRLLFAVHALDSRLGDRVAQTVVKLLIEPELDSIFHPDSYGYRPGRSAKQAVAITRERCWRYDWVVEFDIKAAFDHIYHGLLMKSASIFLP
jgi:retron-type reverse transcriptase